MRQLNYSKAIQFLWYTLPVSIILTMVWLSKSPIFKLHSNELAPAITIDLLLTLPLVYFLIIRKTSVPKTTIVPVLVIGVVTATFILPKDQQGLLDFAKTWLLPFVEIFVVSYVIITVRKSIKAFKAHKTNTFDFYANIKVALRNIVPAKVVPFAAMEISAFYYAFINWRRPKLSSTEFSYHKESGTRAILIVLLFLIALETFVFHILLVRWSVIFAWILTGISIYSGFQILGILKSLNQRPIIINSNKVILKYGIIGDAEINLSNIENITPQKKEVTKESGIVSFSPLGDLEGHNVLITLKHPITIHGFYGIKKEAQTLALFVDQPSEFIATRKFRNRVIYL